HRGRGGVSRALALGLLRVTRSCRRRRVGLAGRVLGRVWRRGRALLAVHCNEHRGSLEKLDLLVLRDEQFGGVGPLGGMLPSTVIKPLTKSSPRTPQPFRRPSRLVCSSKRLASTQKRPRQ